MKVALLTTDNRWVANDYGNPLPHFGPAPTALIEGFTALPEISLHIVSCTRKPVSAPKKLADNIWFHSLHVPKLGWMRTAYQGCIRATRRKLKEIQPDIVHGQGTESDCALGAVFSGFPNVVTLHGNMVEMAPVLNARVGSFHWFAAHFENFVLKRTAGVFCNSNYTAALVRPRARRTWLVPNALRGMFFSTPRTAEKPPRCILLHVGVISHNKQQTRFLEVARALHQERPGFEVHFIGNAHPGNTDAHVFLERLRLAEREGYARHLKTKSANELIDCFDGASALVHTPIAETFGLVVAEALSRDLQFFGFRVGGVPDIVEGVDDARLVGADDWAELQKTITAWLDRGYPAPRPTAKLMRDRYHPEAIAKRHLEIYREVLKR